VGRALQGCINLDAMAHTTRLFTDMAVARGPPKQQGFVDKMASRFKQEPLIPIGESKTPRLMASAACTTEQAQLIRIQAS
jgi:hypothetical protein